MKASKWSKRYPQETQRSHLGPDRRLHDCKEVGLQCGQVTNILGEVAIAHRNEKAKFPSRKSMPGEALRHPDESTLFPVISQDDELGMDGTSDGVTEGKG